MTVRPAVRACWVLAIAGILGATLPRFPGMAHGAEPESRPLTMEELEVRGYRELPGELYLPVPGTMGSSSPVRFDLIREDILKPIPLWEILTIESAKGGTGDDNR